MALTQLQLAVLQTTALIILKHIASYEIDHGSYLDIWEDPVFKNFTSTFLAFTSVNSTNGANTTIVVSNGTLVNPNPGNSTLCDTCSPERSTFYFKTMPIDMVLYALCVPLQYYWNIWLEYLLPARPRGAEVPPKPQRVEKVVLDQNEDQEEEVVQRWIAKGRVRRSSVSWCNTILKWILDVTVGKLLYEVAFHLAEAVLRWKPVTIRGMLFTMAWCWFRSVASVGSFATLVGFIVVPAHRRPTFRAGADLVEAVFYSMFLKIVIPKVIGSDMAQSVMKNSTAHMWESSREGGHGVRLIDEL